MSDEPTSDQPPPPPQDAGPPAPPAAEPPPPPAAAEPPNRALMIVLSYLGPLALIPFVIEQEDREIRWHARHGLVLAAAEIVLMVVLFAFNALITGMIPPLGCILVPLYLLLMLAIFAFHLACIAKGIKGQRLTVPGLSDFADRF